MENNPSSRPKCDGGAAVEFLGIMLPDALWAITAIWPKGIPGKPSSMKNIYTRTFSPSEADECRAWVESMNDMGWNVYFMPNPPKHKINKKATKEDVKEVRYLYVDIDPKPGKDITVERERIKGLLTGTALQNGVLCPTAIVDSGGGYWAFWKLANPVSLEAEDE